MRNGPAMEDASLWRGGVCSPCEAPAFAAGERIRISASFPAGHYRVPLYLQGKAGVIEAVIEAASIGHAEKGFGRNPGARRRHYRIAVPMTDIWPDYVGSPRDGLHLEVCETWLERA